MGPYLRFTGLAAILVTSSGAAFAETAAAPPPSAAAPAAPVIIDGHARWHWELGATGETIFEHTRASLRDPHFGVRVYRDSPIPFTLNNVQHPLAPGAEALAEAPNGNHTFFDVSFGEHMPLFTLFNVNPAHSRYARGVQLNLDGAAFLLLDYTSQSSGVIDTDFRLGGSIDARPWADGWDHLSLEVGFFHESTHLGDEYVLSAATIQGQAPPLANPALLYRANPSYEAIPVVVSVDLPIGDEFSGRLYGGVSKYVASELPNAAFPSEWRAGAELRWTSVTDRFDALVARDADAPELRKRALANLIQRSSGAQPGEPPKTVVVPLRKRRGPFGAELAYEIMARRRYDFVGYEPVVVDTATGATAGVATFARADGYFYVQHATLVGLYNLDTAHSSSNALGVSLDWIRGRSPFGQLIQYAYVDTFALGVSYYW